MAKKSTPVPRTDLGLFDKKPVLGTGIKITNAGDGLSKALQVEPQIMHHGETKFVVLECEVANVAFPPIKDTDGVTRMHTLRAGTATMVDEDLVRELLDAQEEKNKGFFEPKLPYGGDEPDERTAEEIIGGPGLRAVD